MIKEDSLKKRYSIKLISNTIYVIFGFVSISVVPRALGPANYGDFKFITTFFDKFINFLTFETKQAFYTKITKRLKEKYIISFYALILLLIPIVTFFFISLVIFFGGYDYLWLNQEIKYIYAGALFGYLVLLLDFFGNLFDAYALTVTLEKYRIIKTILGSIFLILMFYFNIIYLGSFFLYHILTLSIFILFIFNMLVRKKIIVLQKNMILNRNQIIKYIKEFYLYSHPLIVYSFVGLLAGFGGAWLLQKYAGSTQQGYFGLALRVGIIAHFFAGTLTPLITREFSISWSKNDLQRIADLFKKFIPMMYSISAILSVFFFSQAYRITYLIGGNEYINAGSAVMLLMLRPMHQTYGQLSGSLFFATDNTKTFRNIGIFNRLLSLPITFFLVAPPQYYGLALGAKGLAISILFSQFLATNMQLYFNTRLLNLKFSYFIIHQLYVPILFLILSYFAFITFNEANFYSNKIINDILIIIFSGFLYFFLILVILWVFPRIISLERNDIKSFIKNNLLFLKNRRLS